MKPWWQSKTVWVGIVQAIFAVIDLIAGSPVGGSPEVSGGVAGLGVASILARITKSNVSIQ